MGFQVSPGVQIQERDLTTIIPAVATTSAGIAGQFRWGPIDQRIIIDSESNLIQLFGVPDNNTAKFFFPAANFLGYGNNLQVVRVAGATATNAIGGQTSGLTANVLIKNLDSYNNQTSSGNFSSNSNALVAAKYAGALGNTLKVELCDSTTGFNAWGLSGQFSNTPGTSLYVQSIDGTANDEIHVAVIDEDGLFSGSAGSVLEVYEGLSKATDGKKADGSSNYYANVINQASKYIYWLNHPTGITVKSTGTTSGYGSISYVAGFGATAGLFSTSLSSGVDGGVLTNDQLVNGTGYGATASGYNLFSDSDTVDVSLLIAGPLTGSAAATVANIARTRKDCVAFISTDNLDPTELETTKTNRCTALKSSIGENSYAFIDASWKYQYDRYNDLYRWVPLSGDIAGLAARTDDTNDPWWSPAGYNRGSIKNVIKLGFNPSQTYRDVIYPKGINPVVTFPGQGTILFGDRTAQTKPSAFDRINVRRLFIVLEKAIAIAAKYQLFEFNDAFTRSMFVSMVEPFLRDVQARRGIYDFKVICDETNNTGQVIDSNGFVASIFIKPARSINWITLNFIATRTGVNFEEVTSLNKPTTN